MTATVTKELSGSGGNNNSNNSDASQQNVIIYAASAGVGGLAVGLLLSLFVSRRRSARGKKPGAAVNSFPMSVAAASNNMNASASAHVPISMYSMQSPQGNSTDWLNKEIATQNTEIPFSFYGKQRSQYM